MNKISIQEVKKALADAEFRKRLPPILKADIAKYESNPGCLCNMAIYRNVLKFAAQQLREYFDNAEIVNPDAELMKLAQNHFSVINCHMDELEGKLKGLPAGRKQLAVTRWQDQCTVIINELDIF